MEATGALRVIMEPGDSGVVAHIGLHALFPSRTGLGPAIPSPRGSRSHRPHGLGKASFSPFLDVGVV
jgi:hypothetical protein